MRRVVAIALGFLLLGCSGSSVPIIPDTYWTLDNARDAVTCRLAAFNAGMTSGPDGGAEGSHWACSAPGWEHCSGEFWFIVGDDGFYGGAAGCIGGQTPPDGPSAARIFGGGPCYVSFDSFLGYDTLEVSGATASTVTGTLKNTASTDRATSCTLTPNP